MRVVGRSEPLFCSSSRSFVHLAAPITKVSDNPAQDVKGNADFSSFSQASSQLSRLSPPSLPRFLEAHGAALLPYEVVYEGATRRAPLSTGKPRTTLSLKPTFVSEGGDNIDPRDRRDFKALKIGQSRDTA